MFEFFKGLKKHARAIFFYKSSYRFKRLGAKIAIIVILSAAVFATVRGTCNVICMYYVPRIRDTSCASTNPMYVRAAVSRHATDV